MLPNDADCSTICIDLQVKSQRTKELLRCCSELGMNFQFEDPALYTASLPKRLLFYCHPGSASAQTAHDH